MKGKLAIRPGGVGFLIGAVLILVVYASALEIGIRTAGGEAGSEYPEQPGMRPINALQAIQSFR